jgi:glyoxylase-like metal-dependent hydrolase (beta-lactamase superfamily II)
MFNKYLAVCGLLISIAIVSVQGQDGKAIVGAAAKAMGAENLKTLQLTGSGSAAGIGQNVNPTTGWPTVRVKSYIRQIDLDALASNLQIIRVQNNTDVPLNQVIPPNAPWSQQYDLWLTPYAFLKGAMANPVTVRPDTLGGVKYNIVSFTLQNKYRVEGYINDLNMVERIRTWVDNDVLGDMVVEATYNDYKDFGGVKVPTVLIVKQGGFATLILIVSDAKANVPVTIPPAPAQAAAPAVTVDTEKIADGVYYLKGGTHHSVLVEFADHLTLIEAPQNEARSLALLAEIKKLYPNKPLTEVVNTHHHFDHSGGLRTFVDAGATIITQDINKAFYEKTFAAPHTLNPDKLERSKKKANIVTFGDKKVMSDATRTLELHLIKNNAHNDGILMAFLPKEKILVEADLYTPPAPNAAAPAANAAVNPNALALLTNLETLRLDFDTILPLHGPGKATRADLYAFVRKPFVLFSALPVPAAPGAGGGRGGRGGAAAGGGGGAAAVAGPDAAVATLVNTACAACHTLDRVNNKKADNDAWTTTVTRMKDKGAELTDEQVPLVIEYLARSHGQ